MNRHVRILKKVRERTHHDGWPLVSSRVLTAYSKGTARGASRSKVYSLRGTPSTHGVPRVALQSTVLVFRAA